MVKRAELTDFWRVVFNPSAMDRLIHVLLGAFILGSFFVLSISAYYLLKDRHIDFARKSFMTALTFAVIASAAMLISGDSQGRLVARYQPAKLAAMEGLYKSTGEGAPIHVFGIPDSNAKMVRYNLEIPGLLSFLVHRDPRKPVPGLDQFEPDIPPVALPFFSFHIMVGLGIFFVVLTLYALWCRLRGKLFHKRWLLWTFVFSVVGPFIANELGWIAAEVGRQPWIVYNQLRTADAVSRNLGGGQVLGSIIMFGVIYTLLFALWIYLLNDKIQKGPEPVSMRGQASFRDALEVAARYPGRADSLTEAKE